jgi:hypothetical protein
MKGAALVVLGAASPLALAVLVLPGLFPGASGDWLLAALTGALPVALMAIGALHGGPADRAGRVVGRILLALGALLAAASLGVLALSGRPPSPSLAGLPPAALFQLVGLWLLPLPLATLGYALTFDRAGVDPGALDALRRRARTDR